MTYTQHKAHDMNLPNLAAMCTGVLPLQLSGIFGSPPFSKSIFNISNWIKTILIVDMQYES